MSLQEFKEKFRFDRNKWGYIGIEQESFLCRKSDPMCGRGEPLHIVPDAAKVLRLATERGIPLDTDFEPMREGEFGYELSACQIESRTGPVTLEHLGSALRRTNDRLSRLLSYCSLYPVHTEVGPADMPLDVFPDPTGRYQQLSRDLPPEILSAACRVAGTHVHVGMPDHATALAFYNQAIRHCDRLCQMGDGSNGERLALYRKMAPQANPIPYHSWEEYYKTALVSGFADDPRKCWALIRISVHGTIEFRMFGATPYVDRIVKWSEACYDVATRRHGGF